MPRPTRLGDLVDAGGRGEVVDVHDQLSFGVVRLDLHEVRDAGDHAPDLGAVGQGVGLADAAEAEGAQRAAGLRLGADRRT